MITIVYVIIGLLIYDISKDLIKECYFQFIWKSTYTHMERKDHPDGPMFVPIPTGRYFKVIQLGTITFSYKHFRRTYILYKSRKLEKQ